MAEDGIQVLFCIEYLLRWYSRNCRPSYLLKWEMLVDASAFLPFFLGLAQVRCEGLSLEFLRLLRIARIGRFLRDRASFAQLVGAPDAESIRPFAFEMVRTVCLITTLLFISSGLVYVAEHQVNPAFSNAFVALYFGLVTLTTVGFGDVTPVTLLGRVTISVFILAGVAVVPIQLSRLSSAYFRQMQRRRTASGDESSEDDGDFMEQDEFQKAVLGTLATQQRQINWLAQCAGGGLSTMPCVRCGEEGHQLAALFCFRCGAALTQDEGGSITREEWVRVFDEVDRNGDGKVSREEWRRCQGSLAIFDAIDRNQDDTFSREEWCSAFDELDANKDMVISRAEWTQVAGEGDQVAWAT